MLATAVCGTVASVIAVLPLFAARPAQTAPVRVAPVVYGTYVLPDGGSYAFDALAVARTVEPGPWKRTENGAFAALPGQWVQWQAEGDRGWNDTMLKVNEKGELSLTRHNDPTYWLAAPWKDSPTAAWRAGWYRVWPSAPPGAWYNEVWPKAALTVKTNNSEIALSVSGAYCEALDLQGNGNTVNLYCESGEQARMMLTRATVMVNGSGNTVRGYVKSPMAGVYVRGNSNVLADMVIVAGANGGDIAGAYFEGAKQKADAKHDNRAVNCQVYCLGRAVPVTWLHAAFYFDDWHHDGTLTDCTAYGWDTGVFVHGGDGQRIEQFRALYCWEAVRVAPHFTAPTVVPTAVQAFVTASGQPFADRRWAQIHPLP